MKHRPHLAILVALACLQATPILAAPAPEPILEPAPCDAAGAAGLEALDWAFVFASALETDPKDMGKAQQATVLAYADMGYPGIAAERAELIDGWRRGVALADVAARTAQAGDETTARTLVARAESVADAVAGWEAKRIDAHVADALARLGDLRRSERLAIELASNDPRQYTGRAAASLAVAHASRGEYDDAISALSVLDDANDFDIAWSRTLGYLEVARSGKINDDQRLQALARALLSAESVSGWKRAECELEVAGDYLAVGHRDLARGAIDAAENRILAISDRNPAKPSFLGRVAVLRQRSRQPQQARELLAAGMALVPAQLGIDIPGLYADLATSFHRSGDPAGAVNAFDLAFAAALQLRNARPRALAFTSICIQLGRSEIVLDAEARMSLRRAYTGLTDPW